jgi:DHA1 family tetracycline resistance protein-like MFS transporter
LSPLAIIFVTVFVDLLGFGIIIPLLPFYAETFGANALTIGMLSTSFSLMQFVFAPVWGRLSDRVGRRPIILFGLLGSCVSYLVFGLAHSLPLLFASRIFAGIAGANIPTAQAVIADSTTLENRAKGMGLVGAAFGLGFIFGPAIGGFLSHWGYSTPAFFASALSLVNLVAALFLLPETLNPAHRAGVRRAGGRIEAFRRALDRPLLPLLLLIYFVVTAAFSNFESMFALFAERRFGFQAESIGYVFAFVGVVLVIVQGGLVGPVVRRIGEKRVVPCAAALVAIGLAFLPVDHTIVSLLATLAVMAIGMGFNNPSLVSLISRHSAAEDQGSVLGVSQSLGSLARIVGPAWGGFTFDRYGVDVPYESAAVVMAVAGLVAAVGLWRPDGPAELTRS